MCITCFIGHKQLEAHSLKRGHPAYISEVEREVSERTAKHLNQNVGAWVAKVEELLGCFLQRISPVSAQLMWVIFSCFHMMLSCIYAPAVGSPFFL